MPDASLDVSPLRCPMTWVRTKLALERLSPGQSLEVLLGPGEMLVNVPRNAREEGHTVTSPEPVGADRHLIRITKGA
jgi:tRNA 2-thiouridine synthesizing protein A